MNPPITYKRKSHKEIAINIIAFLLAYIIIFFYQLKIIRNDQLGVFTNTLCLIIFIISIYKIKFGLYFFIFLVPLLNFLPYAFGTSYFPVILFLFFSLFLGFLVNKGSINNKEYKENKYVSKIKKINLLIFLITVILFISSIITIFRYSNFFPFFTNNYYNLNVNIDGLKSNDAIFLIIGSFFNYVSGIGFLLLILNIIDNFDDVKDIIKIIALSSYFYFIIIVIQKFFKPEYGNFEPWISSLRYNGTFTDPNSLGSYTVLVLPILFSAIIYYKKWYLKLIIFISFALVFTSMLLSGSRSAIIGILVLLFVFLIFGFIKFLRIIKSAKKRKKIIYIVTIILIIVIITSSGLFVFNTDNKIKNKLSSFSIIPRVTETVQTAISSYKRDGFIESIKSVSNYRYIFWQRALQMGKDHISTGVGAGAYIIELPDYHWRYNRGFAQVDYPGNYYLQIFAELGISGLFLFLFLFYLVSKKSFSFLKIRKNVSSRNNILFGGLFTSFLIMIFIFIFGSHTNNIEIQFMFWLIVGILLIVPVVENKYLSSSEYQIDKKFLVSNFKNYDLKKYNFFDINFIQKISLIVIILIFTFNLLQASYNGLSIYTKQDKSGWVDVKNGNSFGFYTIEGGSRNGPRFTGSDAGLSLKKEGDILTFALKAKNPDIVSKPLYVKIFLDYKLLKEIKLNDDQWHKLTIDLKEDNLRNITITLVSSRTWIPKEFGINSDTRKLGVMVSSIEFLK